MVDDGEQAVAAHPVGEHHPARVDGAHRRAFLGGQHHAFPAQRALTAGVEARQHFAGHRPGQLAGQFGERRAAVGGGHFRHAALHLGEQLFQALLVGAQAVDVAAALVQGAFQFGQGGLPFAGGLLQLLLAARQRGAAIQQVGAGVGHFLRHPAQLHQFVFQVGEAVGAGTLEVFLVAQQARDLVRLLLVEHQLQPLLAAALVAGAHRLHQPAQLHLLFFGQFRLLGLQPRQAGLGLAGVTLQLTPFAGQLADPGFRLAQLALHRVALAGFLLLGLGQRLNALLERFQLLLGGLFGGRAGARQHQRRHDQQRQ